MQLYGRGVRRRLAPMVGAGRLNVVAHALLMSLPGAPVIRYGEEIGMGDDLSLEGRAAVRTPMQWSSHTPNAGFSTAPADQLARPVLVDGPLGATSGISVEARSAHGGPLLDEVARLVRGRRQNPEIGTGAWEVVDTGSRPVLGIRYRDDGGPGVLITLVNLADEAVHVSPDVLDRVDEVRDVLADGDYAPVRAGQPIPVNGYGYRWLRGRTTVL